MHQFLTEWQPDRHNMNYAFPLKLLVQQHWFTIVFFCGVSLITLTMSVRDQLPGSSYITVTQYENVLGLAGHL